MTKPRSGRPDVLVTEARFRPPMDAVAMPCDVPWCGSLTPHAAATRDDAVACKDAGRYVVHEFCSWRCLSRYAIRRELHPDGIPAPATTPATQRGIPKGGQADRLRTLNATAGDVRAWARDQGIECPTRGQYVPTRVLDLYEAAHRTPTAKDTRP